jgi:uncharacterized protein YjbI with pentapeptide repeats
MPNAKHVAMVLEGGLEALKRERASNPGLELDLSGADFSGRDLRNMDLSSADFRGANFTKANLKAVNLSGANLSEARLDNADLTNANLSDADLTGANLFDADLTGVKVTPTTILKASLLRAKLSCKILSEANIAGADLSRHELESVNLSGRDLRGTRFNHAKLNGANFAGSNLTAAQFEHSTLESANFTNANLSEASLAYANLSTSTLVGADFFGASLTCANLSAANIKHANFHETQLNSAIFDSVEGTYRARNLRTSTMQNDVRYFDKVVREWPERWVDWEMIRIAGRLPLFAASYSALILIPAYLYALEVYNDKVKAARAWIETSGVPARASEAILNHLHEEPIPSRWTLLLVSTILLAAASTIYALACPSRVNSFSRDQWCDEHGHSLVHYWADAWKMRPLRLACAAMYLVGGLGAFYVLITKLWCAGAILLGSPAACF